MRAIPVANPGASYRAHKTEIDAAVMGVLESGWYVMGQEVEQFEREFASYLGTEYCVSTGTGTDALILVLRALGVGPGDVVVTVAHTAVATVSAIDTFADALGRCRAVVGSAGNHLPAECAMLGIPMLALHRGGDGEHEMNAHLVETAGIGIAASFEQCTPELIQRFEAEFDKPRDELAARTRAMRPASEVVPRAIEELWRHRTNRPAWKTRTA